jgi:hypothetical protein
VLRRILSAALTTITEALAELVRRLQAVCATLELRYRSESVLVAVIVLPAALQIWFWSPLYTAFGYFSQSDIYEEFLPQFLAPLMTWSTMEFAGFPVFADPQNAAWYPVQLLARAAGSWSMYVVSAYLIAGVGAAAYAWQITRSRVAALLAGIAWPLSEGMVDLAPHFAMLHGFAWFPLVLFGLEKIAETRSTKWVGATAVIVACFALAGHPQVMVYGGYLAAAYVVTLWWTGGRDPKLARLFAVSLLTGGMLAAIQLVPTLDLASWIARSQVGFNHFADGFTKQPHELMAGIIPQFCHERRETPQYAGILTLVLACAALGASGRNWRTYFWIAIAVICLLLGLGSQTPMASLAYHLPLYDRFRMVARHLGLFVFAVVALASLGAAAVAEGRLKGRYLLSVALPATAALSGLALVKSRPDLFQMPCDQFGLDWIWPTSFTHVESQALLVIAAAGCVLLAGRGGWRRPMAIAMPLLLIFDLLNAQSEPVDRHGLQPSVLKTELTSPSVHAELLREELAPTHQRLLPLEGSATDAVVPGMFARLWNIPSLGGYNPLLPARLHDLTEMNNNGSVGPGLLLPDDVALDLFAVKYVIVRAAALNAPVTIGVDADLTDVPALDMVIGPSDCRPRGPMRLTLGTHSEDVTGVVISGEMRCGDNVQRNAVLGVVTVSGPDGTRLVPLLAGPVGPNGDGLGLPHTPLEHPRPTEATAYTARFAPLRVDTLTIDTTPQRGSVFIDRLAIVTSDDRLHPLTLAAAAPATTRWREKRRFSTSRDSDRGSDGPGRDEVDYVILENMRAFPRAWFVGTAFEVADEQATETLRFGRTRDGEPLQLDSTAFMDTGPRPEMGGGTGSVTVLAVNNGRLALDVTATSAGILMVSELHHPGWRASINKKAAPVVRADYALIGVPVPAGRHQVILTFEPRSLWLGAAISLAGSVVVVFCLVVPLRRKRTTRQTR